MGGSPKNGGCPFPLKTAGKAFPQKRQTHLPRCNFVPGLCVSEIHCTSKFPGAHSAHLSNLQVLFQKALCELTIDHSFFTMWACPKSGGDPAIWMVVSRQPRRKPNFSCATASQLQSPFAWVSAAVCQVQDAFTVLEQLRDPTVYDSTAGATRPVNPLPRKSGREPNQRDQSNTPRRFSEEGYIMEGRAQSFG